jgi:hypothetical protein
MTSATAATASTVSADELDERTVFRRAVEAAIWGMPVVAFDAMRQAFLRDAGASYNDIVYWSQQADWRFQVTTPNASSWYLYLGINTQHGPVVLDVPPAAGAGLFGSLNDAWQVPHADVGPNGEDGGRGGKYLLMPPGYREALPAGYFPVRFDTYNGYSIMRAIPETTAPDDVAKALELVKQARMYPLSQAANPAAQRHIDMAGKLFDAVARFDITFYERLARMVNDEPVQPRDLVAVGQLRSIGIEKGKPFTPDPATREILERAILEARAGFIQTNERLEPFYAGAQWAVPVSDFGHQTTFTFQAADRFALDERGAFFFLGCAPPHKGGVSFYLYGSRDASGAPLEGSKRYRLHVPPSVPARQFWAVTVYDLEESNLMRESPKVEVNSYQDVQENADGSVDVYLGPTAPEGQASNWVYTAPGKRWTTLVRFYGPERPLLDKTWRLPDIAPV